MSGFGNLAVISPAVILVAGAVWLLARAARPVPVTVRPALDPAQHRAVLARYGISTSPPAERSLTLLPRVAASAPERPTERPQASTAA